MLIKKRTEIEIPSSEITPESVYLNRRQFMTGLAAAAGAGLLAACAPRTSLRGPTVATDPTPESATDPAAAGSTRAFADELGDPLTAFAIASTYNNFYEFSTDKEEVARKAKNFKTDPWTVSVGGLVRNPRTYDLDDLRAFGREERVYRLRCVEGWSMVIPWDGFPLARLLEQVEPTAEAKFVRFETLHSPLQMPGQLVPLFAWPYVEGLRLDEAMNDLTLLAMGMYGRDLPPQNGAPFRLVVPWKYGFKSIKSIVKIDLVDTMPTSLWMAAAPDEYGFYANVNPEVDHPRWSQSSERRIGERERRPTLMFNGYAEQVAALYAGMDLRANY